MKIIRLVVRYGKHILTARNTGGFGVHSPYIFNFIQGVLKEKHPFYIFNRIEQIREKLCHDNRTIQTVDFGTGKSGVRIIADIASKASKQPKIAQLLFRIIQYYRFNDVLELGTSLGISTMYMASATKDGYCMTLEGCPETASIARANFNELGATNIKLITCNINEILEDILKKQGKQDFIFIDANHRYEALIEYFNTCVNYLKDNSIIVIDDIYWSKGMEKAWTEIKEHPQISATIDIFHLGIVFFNPELKKKHYKIRF